MKCSECKWWSTENVAIKDGRCENYGSDMFTVDGNGGLDNLYTKANFYCSEFTIKSGNIPTA